MKNTLEQAMKKHGLETEIRNIVFHLIRTSIKSDTKISMQAVRSTVRSSDYSIYYDLIYKFLFM